MFVLANLFKVMEIYEIYTKGFCFNIVQHDNC